MITRLLLPLLSAVCAVTGAVIGGHGRHHSLLFYMIVAVAGYAVSFTTLEVRHRLTRANAARRLQVQQRGLR